MFPQPDVPSAWCSHICKKNLFKLGPMVQQGLGLGLILRKALEMWEHQAVGTWAWSQKNIINMALVPCQRHGVDRTNVQCCSKLCLAPQSGHLSYKLYFSPGCRLVFARVQMSEKPSKHKHVQTRTIPTAATVNTNYSRTLWRNVSFFRSCKIHGNVPLPVPTNTATF